MLKWFKHKGLGNPFNYNRFMEFIQARLLGYKLTEVGGGSDGINELNETTEFKATKYLGTTKAGVDKSLSFAYNGTTRKATLEEQEVYCKEKVMRDPLHHWTVIDYEEGKCLYTIQLTNEQVWEILCPSGNNHGTIAKQQILGSVHLFLLLNLIKQASSTTLFNTNLLIQ